MRGVGEFAVIHDSSLFVAEAPEFAGVIIAIDMMPAESSLSRVAVVSQAVGDRRGLGMRMVDRRRQDRGRSAGPFGVGRLAAFHDAPSRSCRRAERDRSFPTTPSRHRRPTDRRSGDRSSSARGCESRRPRFPRARLSGRRTDCRPGSGSSSRPSAWSTSIRRMDDRRSLISWPASSAGRAGSAGHRRPWRCRDSRRGRTSDSSRCDRPTAR